MFMSFSTLTEPGFETCKKNYTYSNGHKILDKLADPKDNNLKIYIRLKNEFYANKKQFHLWCISSHAMVGLKSTRNTINFQFDAKWTRNILILEI